MPTTHRSAYGLDSDPDTPSWRTQANCGPQTAELFWPEGSKGPLRYNPNVQAALRLCETCPVIADCLAYEVANPARVTHVAAGKVWTRAEGRRVLDGGGS